MNETAKGDIAEETISYLRKLVEEWPDNLPTYELPIRKRQLELLERAIQSDKETAYKLAESFGIL